MSLTSLSSTDHSQIAEILTRLNRALRRQGRAHIGALAAPRRVRGGHGGARGRAEEGRPHVRARGRHAAAARRHQQERHRGRPVRRHRRRLRRGLAPLQAVLHDGPAHRDRRRHQGHREPRAARLRPRQGRRAARAARQRAHERVVRAVRAQGPDAVPMGRPDRARGGPAARGASAPLGEVQGGRRALARPRDELRRGGHEPWRPRGGRWVEAAWRRGARFDAWTEAFRRRGLARRRRGAWGSIPRRSPRPSSRPTTCCPGRTSPPRSHRSFLARERERAAAGITTPDCTFENCSACGACPTLGVDIELQQEREGKEASPARNPYRTVAHPRQAEPPRPGRAGQREGAAGKEAIR